MSTVRERVIINEKSCANNIQDFFDTNALEETDEIDDLVECIKRIAEICKEYRHAHADLEVLLGEQYMHEYTNSRQVAERMKEYTKNAKSKHKNFKKRKELEIKENYAEFDRKKILYEEEYGFSRLTGALNSIDLDTILETLEIKQAIVRLNTLLEDYLRLQCNIKVVVGDRYEKEFNQKVDGISKLVYTKIWECNSKVEEINQVQIDREEKRIAQEEELKLAEAQKRTQKALDLKKTRFIAYQASL